MNDSRDSKKNKKKLEEFTKETAEKIIEKDKNLFKFFLKNISTYKNTSIIFSVFSFTIFIFYIQYYGFYRLSSSRYSWDLYIWGLLLFYFTLFVFILNITKFHELNEKIHLIYYNLFDDDFFENEKSVLKYIKKIKSGYFVVRSLTNTLIISIFLTYAIILSFFNILVSFIMCPIIIFLTIYLLIKEFKVKFSKKSRENYRYLK